MIDPVLPTACQRLPQSARAALRRFAFRVRRRRQYRRMKFLRTAVSNTGYSLMPFDRHRCIFVHIPKCAGVSISRSLFGNLGGAHRTILEYQCFYSPRDFRDYFKFTFVRNPWDRLVSAYTFLKKGGFHDEDRRWAEANLEPYPDFDRFVRGWVNPQNVTTWKHFRPQQEYLCDTDGRLMIDFMGRFENMPEDFAHVCGRIGVEAELLSLNVTSAKRKDFRTFYTDETRQIVADVYRQDIEICGYNFDNSTLKPMRVA